MNDKTEWMNKKADRTNAAAREKVGEAMRLLREALDEALEEDAE